jgi:hypothetical protein
MRTREIVSVGGSVAILVLAALPAAASASEGLALVGEPGVRALSVSRKGKVETGSVRLLVRNETAVVAHPHVRFIPAFSAGKPSLEYSVSPIPPGKLAAITVKVSVAAGNSLIGTLALKADGGSETAVPVTLGEAGSPVAVEPGQVTVHLTRKCPSWLGHVICGDSAPPTVAIASGVLEAAPGGRLKRIASSNTGGTATIELKHTSINRPLPAGMSAATVVIKKADTHGGYSTIFSLMPEAKQGGSLTVNLEVQDWWLIPFLVLLFGAVCGFLVRWLMGGFRDKLVLKAQLIEQRKIYGSRLAERSKGIYPLEGWFGPFGTLLPVFPSKPDCGSDSLTGFGEVCCQVLRARSAEEVQGARETAERIRADVEMWRQTNRALKELARIFASAEPDATARQDDSIPAFLDTRMLIEEQVIDAPKDDDSGKTLLATIRGQGNVVSIYAQARRLWNRLPPDKQNTEQQNNPYTIYKEAGDVLDRTPEKTETLKAALAEAALRLRQLLAPDHEVPPIAIALAETLRASPRARALTSAAPEPIAHAVGIDAGPEPPAGQPGGGPPAPIGESPIQPSDPVWIRGMVRRIDVAVFVATLLGSTTVYFLTLYVGKDFGGTSQYVQAFAAGFAGQALVGVATIPLARSVLTVGKQAAS